MLTQRRKILFSIVASLAIGFSVLFGASVALAFQPPTMNQQFSMNSNFPPNVGFSGSQFNTMIPNSAQMMGGMNQGMMGAGSVGMNPMMNMMNMMMPAMFGQSSMGNMRMPMIPSIIPLAGPTNNNGSPLDSTRVISRVSDFLDELNNPDLKIGVLNENSNNFYVAIQEKSTGVYAFDLLVDKMTGAIYAEPGPNMIWNAKYRFMSLLGSTMQPNQFNTQANPPMMDSMSSMDSGMGGAMDNMSSMQSGNMMNPKDKISFMMTQIAHMQIHPFASTMLFVTPQDAQQIAQQFLNTNLQGPTVEKIRMYYGYYTVDVSINGQNHSSLAVNGYTGQVWYKTWHDGMFQQLNS